MRLYALALLALLLAGAAPARADTPLALSKSFDGRVNFTGTQVSLRTRSNKDNACTVTSPNTNRTASLKLPDKASVLSAQLYWAGSGTTDSTVSFEGKRVTARRRYTSSTVGNGFRYFGGAVDVTAVVKAKGSGTYNFSGLGVSNGSPWCASQGVLGGFSLLVVYSHSSEPERVLNLYEGFSYVQNSEVTVNASNFRWNRAVLPVQEKARIGHITWEGDPTLASDGERLVFEGEEVSDTLNPEGNQFNSRSNINNDSASYGIDFDAYDTSVLISPLADARVTTRYRTGQDMVLLNAEILVVPTMPVSDLSIAIARTANLFQVGKNAVYAVTVTNHGPYTEAGPITVASTLPNGLSYVSASGTGWACAASGQALTCTHTGSFAPGTNAATLHLTVAVTTTGQKKTTVTVKGTDDDDASNNSASNTATAADAEVTPGPPPVSSATSYVFTDGACKAGIAIGAAGQTCKHYAAATVGGRETTIYLTAMSNKVPAAAKTTLTPSFQFALECVLPETGTVGARFAEIPLRPCAEGGRDWSDPVKLTFPKNEASVKQAFVYHDIGRVRLRLKEGTDIAATQEFVVAPVRIAFKSIRSGNLNNPGFTGPGDPGFVPAGTMLTVEIGALLEDGKTFAPNFREAETTGVELEGAAIRSADAGSLVEEPPRSIGKGILATQARWSEAGAANFVARLRKAADAEQYGTYLGVQVPGSTAPVGRFYPAYFTTVVTGPFVCPGRLPAGTTCPIDGNAVYSGQPFNVTVRAFNAANEQLQNFKGDWFKPLTLVAVDAAGGGPMPRLLGARVDPATPPNRIQYLATYALETPFVSPPAPPAAWSLPTPVFVRAAYSETTVADDKVEVSSLRSAGVVAAEDAEASEEGGILVLAGRLKVSNVLGSDLLRTRVPLGAEYWAGPAGWLPNPGYADTAAVTNDNVRLIVRLIECRGKLAVKDATGKEVCNPAVAGAVAPQNVALTGSPRGLQLRAPGKQPGGGARSGSISLQFRGWDWLPSTTGKVTFGIHRSPVIYVRELYF